MGERKIYAPLSGKWYVVRESEREERKIVGLWNAQRKRKKKKSVWGLPV